jgi:DNA-binding NarL/FixJ family response regulator
MKREEPDRHNIPFRLETVAPVIVAHELADRAALLRRRLSHECNILVIGAGDVSVEDLLREASRIGPSVLIVDEVDVDELETLNLPESIDFGRTVRILVVGDADDERERALIQLGCMGLVDASAAPVLLVKAVRALIRGEMWFSRRSITSSFQELLQGSRANALTSRESQILELITAGHNNRAIANELSISYDTVRWHIRRLNAKLKTTEPPVSPVNPPGFRAAAKPPSKQDASAADRLPSEFVARIARSGRG